MQVILLQNIVVNQNGLRGWAHALTPRTCHLPDARNKSDGQSARNKCTNAAGALT